MAIDQSAPMIAVLDFGGQTAALIARRLRDNGVYAEVFPGDIAADRLLRPDLRGIIMSGSPSSVHDADAPAPDPLVYRSELPILGICYGLQRMVHDHGGRVEHSEKREYGRSRVVFAADHPLFTEVPDRFISWMSHGDAVGGLPTGATAVATSEHGLPACVELSPGRVGIQFHPEVTHCEFGDRILTNFAREICGVVASWSMDRYLENASEEIRRTVGDEHVLLLISGGVDSTVVAALLLKALDPDRIHLMYIDTGLMRKAETDEVRASLEQLGARHLHLIDAEQRFLDALAGVSDPERKREIIGDLFITVQQHEIALHLPHDYYLAQGTLYTDMIESGRGVGEKAHVIKSHHNVRSPLVAKKREAGRVVEPLRFLYKDEVRRLGLKLGVAESVIRRHPFPGPGLAVRILGEVTFEKCEVLRCADAIYIQELKRRDLYHRIWQAFSVLLPVKAVGVTGDTRSYGYVLALRAVISHDGMTADVYPFESADVLEIAARITNEVPAIGRVVYDISSKPPATIEWE